MNFMKNLLKKNLLTATIAVVVVLSVLGGCKKKDDNGVSDTVDINVTKPTKNASLPNNDNSEMIDISGGNNFPEAGGDLTGGAAPFSANDDDNAEREFGNAFPENSKAESYFNMFSSGSDLHIKAKMLGLSGDEEASTEMYYKSDMSATVIKTSAESMRVVFNSGKLYLIDDAAKSYIVSETTEVPSASDNLILDSMSYLSSGSDEFNGKTLYYEEYTDAYEYKGSTQWFFDGDILAGMRDINTSGTFDTVYLEIDQNIPDSVFEIPSSYKDETP